MTKLNQILALKTDAEQHAQAALTRANGALGNPGLMSGLSRTYRPIREDGDQLPAESTRVQVKAEDILTSTQEELVRLFDLTATIDYANCEAKADVVVGDAVLVRGAPTTYLLWLAKRLQEIEGLVRRLPTLDQAEVWHRDEAQGLWATPPTETIRTKKLPKNHVLAEATKEHPAQVQVYTEDVAEGRWTQVKFSGAVPQPRLAELLERVRAVQAAVKTAREEANMHQITDQRVGETILSYLFG